MVISCEAIPREIVERLEQLGNVDLKPGKENPLSRLLEKVRRSLLSSTGVI